VITVGEGVDRSWLERRVFTMVAEGGYAERVAVEASHLVPLPPAMKAADAVALGGQAPSSLVGRPGEVRACA
jgi:NADPH:quinone reductase